MGFVLQIRILCGVDHDDLKKLFHVSKMFREAVSVHYDIINESFMVLPWFHLNRHHLCFKGNRNGNITEISIFCTLTKHNETVSSLETYLTYDNTFLYISPASCLPACSVFYLTEMPTETPLVARYLLVVMICFDLCFFEFTDIGGQKTAFCIQYSSKGFCLRKFY